MEYDKRDKRKELYEPPRPEVEVSKERRRGDTGRTSYETETCKSHSLDIEKHCVWGEDDNADVEAFNGAFGKKCKEDKECKTTLGEEGVSGQAGGSGALAIGSGYG